MNGQEAQALASYINSESKQFEALFVAMGSLNLVLLRDRVDNHLPTPVVSVTEYLELVTAGSTLVETSPELRRLLTCWSHLRQFFLANISSPSICQQLP